ncbi:MAG: MBL fold metallo-hydrolase [Deltaproteobacteria bacterium]|jgi:ribonuclease BN (tRNA processing enzyme)|nr:MBL fold metallo-hydrolase [Deltaproteobacteria bacterium]
MRIKFWGVRGSVPCPPTNEEIRAKIKMALTRWTEESTQSLDEFLDSLPGWISGLVGGNTICLEISDNEELLVFDAGTGLIRLGNFLIPAHLSELFERFYSAEKFPALCSPPQDGSLRKIKIFMTHTHWDHIQGFPFFRPAYVPYYHLEIYGADRVALKTAFETQMLAPSLFPVPLSFLKAKTRFHNFPLKGLKTGQFRLDCLALPHPGGSLAYRIQSHGKTVVFATDYEVQKLSQVGEPGPSHAEVSKFIRGADVLISDTQYTYLDHASKVGWGHSNALSVVELAAQAGVRALYLFHHDPTYNDEKLLDILEKTRAYAKLLPNGADLAVSLALEGLTIDL